MLISAAHGSEQIENNLGFIWPPIRTPLMSRWSRAARERLQKFSGYSLVQPLANRALGYISSVLTAQLVRLKKALRLTR
jgi:hypothetical protein